LSVQFLSGLFRLPFSSGDVTVAGGGAFSSGVTLNLFISGQNRAGFTVPSPIVTVTLTSTQSATITLPEAARGAGTDFHYYWLCHTPTGNVADGFALAGWKNYEADQSTRRTLSPITLSRPAHIAIAASVASESALPSGNDLVYGMTRAVVSVNGGASPSAYYRYDPLEVKVANGNTIIARPSFPLEKWVKIGAPFLGLINNPNNADGCAQAINTLTPELIAIASPLYAADGAKGKGVHYAIYNDTGVEMLIGRIFALQILLDGVLKSYLFDKKIIVTFRGYVNYADGSVDRSDIVGNMPGVDGDMVWSYGDRGNLFLPKSLPSNWAAWFEIAPMFNTSQIAGVITEGTPVSLNLVEFQQAGEFAGNLHSLLGDSIFPAGDKLRVVPETGLGAKILGGSALVKRYSFQDKGEQGIYGLIPDFANQLITIDGNGSVFNRTNQSVPTTEVIRAIVSTETGYATPSGYYNRTLTVAGGLTVTCQYPCNSLGFGTVRSNYPVIGSITKGRFNPNSVAIYIKQGSTISRIVQPLIPGVSQTFNVTSLTGATVVASLPSSASAFSLFNAPTATIGTISGTIAPANYEIAVGYYYDGSSITSIDHPGEANGGISEINQTVGESLAIIAGANSAIAELQNRDGYIIISASTTLSSNRKYLVVGGIPTLPSVSGWLEVGNDTNDNLAISAPSSVVDGLLIPSKGKALFVADGSDWRHVVDGEPGLQIITSMPLTAVSSRKYLVTLPGTINIPASSPNNKIEFNNASNDRLILSRSTSIAHNRVVLPGQRGFLYGGLTDWHPIHIWIPRDKAVITYTGVEENFVVPLGVNFLEGLLWGPGGASGIGASGGNGGGGGWVQFKMPVTSGTTYSLFVGQGGQLAVGGIGGGGSGGAGVGTGTAGGAGGSRTSIRLGANLIAVAGGGGGGGGNGASASWGVPGIGGAAGGTSGVAGASTQSGVIAGGVPGTQTTGAGLTNGGVGAIPLFLGAAGADSGGGGGGGGGFYGGTGGSANTQTTNVSANGYPGGGGAGGSGFTASGLTVLSFLAGSGRNPPGMTDVDYANNAGLGGTAGSNGSHGRIIIRWGDV